MKPSGCRCVAALFAFAFAAGCSQGGGQSAAPAAPNQRNARAGQASEKLKLYQQMLDSHREDLAAPIGEEIVNEFAGTPAAAEVRKTLPQIEAKAKAQAEHR